MKKFNLLNYPKYPTQYHDPLARRVVTLFMVVLLSTVGTLMLHKAYTNYKNSIVQTNVPAPVQIPHMTCTGKGPKKDMVFTCKLTEK